MTKRDRHILFEACFNCRDLGGYTTNDGRLVRWGVVFRSGSLHRLTTADLETAKRLGLRTVIDLRSTAELERNGRYLGNDVAFHHAPLFEEDTMPFKWAEPDDPEPPPGEDYIAIAATGASSLAEALGVIAESQHPVVIHCAAGKDRTGILTALLLSTLGVPDDTIAYDYELSNLSLPAHLAWAEMNDPEEAAEIATRPPWLLQSSGSVIRAFLKTLRSRYGSTDSYLTTALGVSPDVIENLRVRLLDQA